MLVEDLAMLRWEKRRNQRAQAAAISYEMEQLDISTEELRKQRDREESGMSFDRAAVEEKGLINMPDCPGKFRQIRESLKVLLEQVDRKHLKWYHLNGGYRGCSGCSNLLDDPSEFE